MARSSTLEKRLGYEFENGPLLAQALTHRSYGSPHNERLEFLGDGVLNCVIAEELCARFPKFSEGELSRMRANLVCKESLASLAQRLGLSDFLRLGEGELASGGGNRPSILANALEAVYGAVFLDGGYPAAREAIRRTYATELAQLAPGRPTKDAKTRLQEYLQAHKRTLAEYRVVATRGAAHQQIFEVQCTVPALGLGAGGTGRTRRLAEQDAAEQILKKIET